MHHASKNLTGARRQQGFSPLPGLKSPSGNGGGGGSQVLPQRGIRGMDKSVPFTSFQCRDSGLARERNAMDATTEEF